MGAGHHHDPAGRNPTGHAAARYRGRLWAALCLLVTFLGVEVTAGLLTGSLALLSDAGHMLTDVIGIAMALAAVSTAARARADGRRTFGLYRLEVLAALANAVLLGGVTVGVGVEAVRRLSEPVAVPAGPLLAVAVAGTLVNLVALALLRAGAPASITVRAAYLEVLGDLVGSLGVVAAAVVLATTGWAYADPVAALAVAALVLPRAVVLARAAVRILVQAAPEHLDVGRVRDRLAAVPGVCDVHDLHVWTLTSGMEVASAHLRLAPAAELGTVLTTAREALHADFAIDHATLQVEPAGSCRPATW